MNNLKISHEEKRNIRTLIRNIKFKSYSELDISRQREDFYGLYTDIICQFSGKSKYDIKKIYELSELMDRFEKLFSPSEAYIYGREAKQNGITFIEGLKNYFTHINNTANEKGLSAAKDAKFQDLCNLLGDKKGLVIEFVERHQQVTSVVNHNIDQFYTLGYEYNQYEFDNEYHAEKRYSP